VNKAIHDGVCRGIAAEIVTQPHDPGRLDVESVPVSFS